MMFLRPIWLVFAIPLALTFSLWQLPSTMTRALRITVYVLLLLSMAGLAWLLPFGEGVVIVVADRSRSMPADADQRILENISLLRRTMPDYGRFGVVTFGERSVIEMSPSSEPFAGFLQDPGGDASNLYDALEQAISLIPHEMAGRIVILSDGRWTGVSPARSILRAAGRGIPLDFRSFSRGVAADLAINTLELPAGVAPGERFLLTVSIAAPRDQEVNLVVYRQRTPILSERRAVKSGLNRVMLSDSIEKQGVVQYSVQVAGTYPDPVPENNNAKALLTVRGPKPLLYIGPSATMTLPGVLRNSGIDVYATTADRVFWSLEELAQYSGVILENVPAQDIGLHGMTVISAWVRELGNGFMLTGGKNSFGPGGYFRSPIEDLLPVSMELRSDRHKIQLAIVIVLDRSGSMSMPAGHGRSKMDLANLGAAETVNLLTDMDEIGVLAVDTAPHVIQPLTPVKDKAAIKSNIQMIESMGGGIYVYEGLRAAAQMLERSNAKTRHIILFADAADAEQPGQYWQLIEECRKANMTISVIGLGLDTDCDAELLRDIAQRGEGRIFFSDNAEELPRLFAQDTFVAARSAFIEEPTDIALAPGMKIITPQNFAQPPPLGGYSRCYSRPDAALGIVSVDDNNAPIVAAWQVGIGRALCFTGEVDGDFSGEFGKWSEVGDFYGALARWVAGQGNMLEDGMQLTQEVKNGLYRLTLHLDPERAPQQLDRMPVLQTLRARSGKTPQGASMSLQWDSPTEVSAELPLSGDETVVSTLSFGKSRNYSLDPVCLPYSPEFRVDDEKITAGSILEVLARGTGGRERLDLVNIWKDLSRTSRYVEISPILILGAILLFLLEILDRRTGLVTAFHRRFLRQPATKSAASHVTAANGKETGPEQLVGSGSGPTVGNIQQMAGAANGNTGQTIAINAQSDTAAAARKPAEPAGAATSGKNMRSALKKARGKADKRIT